MRGVVAIIVVVLAGAAFWLWKHPDQYRSLRDRLIPPATTSTEGAPSAVSDERAPRIGPDGIPIGDDVPGGSATGQPDLQTFIGESVVNVERATGCRAQSRVLESSFGIRGKEMSLDCAYKGGKLSVGFNAQYRMEYDAVYGKTVFILVNPEIRAQEVQYVQQLPVDFERFVQDARAKYGPINLRPCWARSGDDHGCLEGCLTQSRAIKLSSSRSSGEFTTNILDYVVGAAGYSSGSQPGYKPKSCS
jgi:hypothetical protein